MHILRENRRRYRGNPTFSGVQTRVPDLFVRCPTRQRVQWCTEHGDWIENKSESRCLMFSNSSRRLWLIETTVRIRSQRYRYRAYVGEHVPFSSRNLTTPFSWKLGEYCIIPQAVPTRMQTSLQVYAYVGITLLPAGYNRVEFTVYEVVGRCSPKI